MTQKLYIVTSMVQSVSADMEVEGKNIEVNVDIRGFGSIGMYPVFKSVEEAQKFIEERKDIGANIIEIAITPTEEGK